MFLKTVFSAAEILIGPKYRKQSRLEAFLSSLFCYDSQLPLKPSCCFVQKSWAITLSKPKFYE